MFEDDEPLPKIERTKDCPFCGADVATGGHFRTWEHHKGCRVGCTNCGAEGPLGNSEETALAYWNDRPDDSDGSILEKIARIQRRRNK